MKNIYILITFIILAIEINPKFLRNLQSSINTYDYSSYNSVSINEDLTNKILSSNISDQSVVYITNSDIKITRSSLTKSGNSANIENSEFYGVNSALLVQGGDVTISGGQVITNANGGNAICVTNNGVAQISEGTLIKSTAESSARGLYTTYGGTIIAKDITVITQGSSCASLTTDRGEGTVTCTGCNLYTEGKGSPLIYSRGTIIVNGKSKGTSSGAQMVVVEGKNTVSIANSDFKCSGEGNKDNNVDKCGVMLYQSMSGDANEGNSKFNCQNSNMEIESSSNVYSSAPMFFITNTDAKINLNECNFKYGSNIFLNVSGTNEWGESGSNGGNVILTLNNQNIEGDFVVYNDSELIIKMTNSTIKGTINGAKTAESVEIDMDKNSRIILTGNSYYTKLNNLDSTGSNIKKGSYSFSSYDDDIIIFSNSYFLNRSIFMLLLLAFI